MRKKLLLTTLMVLFSSVLFAQTKKRVHQLWEERLRYAHPHVEFVKNIRTTDDIVFAVDGSLKKDLLRIIYSNSLDTVSNFPRKIKSAIVVSKNCYYTGTDKCNDSAFLKRCPLSAKAQVGDTLKEIFVVPSKPYRTDKVVRYYFVVQIFRGYVVLHTYYTQGSLVGESITERDLLGDPESMNGTTKVISLLTTESSFEHR